MGLCALLLGGALRLSCGAARAMSVWGQCTTNFFFFLFLFKRGGQKFSLFRLVSPEYPTRVRGIAYVGVYPREFSIREEAPITIAVCELFWDGGEDAAIPTCAQVPPCGKKQRKWMNKNAEGTPEPRCQWSNHGQERLEVGKGTSRNAASATTLYRPILLIYEYGKNKKSMHQIVYIKIYTSNILQLSSDPFRRRGLERDDRCFLWSPQPEDPVEFTSKNDLESARWNERFYSTGSKSYPGSFSTERDLFVFSPFRFVCHSCCFIASWCIDCRVKKRPGQSAIESLFVCNGKTLLEVVNRLFSWFEKMERESKTDYLTARTAMGIAKGWK